MGAASSRGRLTQGGPAAASDVQDGSDRGAASGSGGRRGRVVVGIADWGQTVVARRAVSMVARRAGQRGADSVGSDDGHSMGAVSGGGGGVGSRGSDRTKKQFEVECTVRRAGREK
jgi:hypothetical protein